LIVITVDKIENFINFLDRRVMNEIFYEYNEIKNEQDLTCECEIEIILHFLGKIEEFLVLYGTQLKLKKKTNSEVEQLVIDELKKIFNQVDPNLLLVKGKIKEVFISYST